MFFLSFFPKRFLTQLFPFDFSGSLRYTLPLTNERHIILPKWFSTLCCLTRVLDALFCTIWGWKTPKLLELCKWSLNFILMLLPARSANEEKRKKKRHKFYKSYKQLQACTKFAVTNKMLHSVCWCKVWYAYGAVDRFWKGIWCSAAFCCLDLAINFIICLFVVLCRL